MLGFLGRRRVIGVENITVATCMCLDQTTLGFGEVVGLSIDIDSKCRGFFSVPMTTDWM